MNCEVLSLEYYKGEREGYTGVKKGTHPFIQNGTGYEFEESELVLSVSTDENKEIHIDIRKDILKAFGRKKMSDKFYNMLLMTKPEYVDVFKKEDYYVSKTSLSKWKQNCENI